VILREISDAVLKTNKEHISFNEVKDWKECSLRHKLKHIDKIDMFEENVFTNFGTAIHASCEEYVKTRIMRYEIALDIILQAWKEHKLPEVGLWLKRCKVILDAVPAWLDMKFPNWEHISSEEELMEPIPGIHKNIKFKGFIDAVIKWNDEYYLIDWKTSSTGWNDYKRKDEMLKRQLVLYKDFWARKHNIDLDKIKCGFVILNRKLEHPERIDYFTFDADKKRRTISLDIVNTMISNVKAGVIIPSLKKEELRFQGVCRFCDYNGTQHCR